MANYFIFNSTCYFILILNMILINFKKSPFKGLFTN